MTFAIELPILLAFTPKGSGSLVFELSKVGLLGANKVGGGGVSHLAQCQLRPDLTACDTRISCPLEPEPEPGGIRGIGYDARTPRYGYSTETVPITTLVLP